MIANQDAISNVVIKCVREGKGERSQERARGDTLISQGKCQCREVGSITVLRLPFEYV